MIALDRDINLVVPLDYMDISQKYCFCKGCGYIEITSEFFNIVLISYRVYHLSNDYALLYYNSVTVKINIYLY